MAAYVAEKGGGYVIENDQLTKRDHLLETLRGLLRASRTFGCHGREHRFI